MFRLSHNKLNIDGRCNRMYQCSELQLNITYFEYPSTCGSRQFLYCHGFDKNFAAAGALSGLAFNALCC